MEISNPIFASGPHLMNDLFKFWLAKKNLKLFVVRHGGSFPNENFYLHKHEKIISSKIITSFKYPKKNFIQLPSIKIKKNKIKRLFGKKNSSYCLRLSKNYC